MKLTRTRLAPLAGALLFVIVGAAQAAGMQVSSASFADGATIPTLHGNNTSDCGGKGVSPQVSWSNLPAGTKSVAVLLSDPDGNMGLGVSHWVAYNIAADRGQLKEGEGQADGHGATLGKNVRGEQIYRGPCPSVGDAPHHYTLTVIATDLAPTALPPGLSREELMQALKGHALGGQSVVGRYAR
ncbi:YbhB/YbcL family Raf kinase inhibitor-like protein [Cupriavidus sp. CuC1]|uniref:YbhB/YbcL family Raf kinase inhibitor-like protein n=1 Tax=Cupriavidus sp. CuC1 TaxID=3373131 RepID=UPI0037D71CFB